MASWLMSRAQVEGRRVRGAEGEEEDVEGMVVGCGLRGSRQRDAVVR